MKCVATSIYGAQHIAYHSWPEVLVWLEVVLNHKEMLAAVIYGDDGDVLFKYAKG